METLIRQNIVKIRETQAFINEYLSKKNKGVEKTVYLSVYINLENAKSTKLIHLKKIIREINLTLNSKLPPAIATKILKNVESLNILEFNKYKIKSIALFATDDFIGLLPVDENIQEGVYVAKSLHLKPILKWIYNWNKYYIITLSPKSIKLLLADDFEIKEIRKIESEENNKIESSSQKSNFFKNSLNEINSIISRDNHPVILAGVRENIELAKKHCKDPDISIYTLTGNYDYVSYNEVHFQSLKILRQIRFDKDIFIQSEVREKKNKLEKDLGLIIQHAITGKIQNLLVAKDKILWGNINKSSGNYELFMNQNLAIPGDDILDDLAEIVLAKGGKISVLEQKEIPYNLEALAILR